MNPVKAGLVDSPEQYPYCFEFLANKKAAGAEALVHSAALSARLKSCPDTKQEIAEDRSDQPSNIQKAESE
jgi:hypothetical protein